MRRLRIICGCLAFTFLVLLPLTASGDLAGSDVRLVRNYCYEAGQINTFCFVATNASVPGVPISELDLEFPVGCEVVGLHSFYPPNTLDNRDFMDNGIDLSW